MQAGVDPAILAALSAALQGPISPLPSYLAEARPQPRSMHRPSAGWMLSTERDGSCLARLTVDALKVGSLLGKRGGNIAQIRQVGPVPSAAQGMPDLDRTIGRSFIHTWPYSARCSCTWRRHTLRAAGHHGWLLCS